MKTLVLLSDGRHPVSGLPALAPTELQAIALAGAFGGEIAGLHAGPTIDAARTALGHGLSHLDHRAISADDDPLPSLVAAIRARAPDLVLAGRRGGAGAQTGLLPYRLAQELGWPIIADAVSLRMTDDIMEVIQARPRGARRRYRVALPAIVTVHPAAAPAHTFARGTTRMGRIEEQPGIASALTPSSLEERAYRPKPRLISPSATGATAAERLKAATQAASAGGQLLVDLSPEDAARAILDHLRAIGALKPARRGAP